MSAQITINGNLANDPELKTTAKGTSVANFVVITSRSTKDTDGNWQSVDVTGWPCTAWGGLAEVIANNFHKGDGVILVGNVSERSWTNKAGEEVKRMEVNVKDAAMRLKKGYNDSAPEVKEKSGIDPWAAPPQTGWANVNAPF
jgi:single-strand DNA-binding protein